MRVIFLNSWFGQVEKPFFDFIEDESQKTDIFCLVEVSKRLFTRLGGVLKNFKGTYELGNTVEALGFESGQSIFLRKGISNLLSGKISIYRQIPTDVGFLQYVHADMNGINFWIGNVHGKARPGEKEDTPVRIKQSEKIINYFKDLAGPKIIGGDFNLNPDTKSVEMFEKAGYRNLIKDFGIKNTRNKLSWEQFNNVQNFADYCFTSPEVKVKSFKVPYMEISDHLPQILDFEV